MDGPRGHAVDSRPGLRILVVDDSEDTARMMRVLLKGEGHEVRVAFAGREAVALAEAFHPDVVLLDLTLPDMSGAEVAEALRKADGPARTTLVAVTGFGADQVPAVFDGHFVKPVDHDALRAFLGRLTAGAGGPESP
jgi:CheY-like chemotaxis protein